MGIEHVAVRLNRCLVMAGLVPAIHDLLFRAKVVDARDKRGHDHVNLIAKR
jgi:hypothetical protein